MKEAHVTWSSASAAESADSGAGERSRPGADVRSTAPSASRDAVRERVLDAFASRARTAGIRRVIMGELASDLGISKRTVYELFESKAAIVHALVERWAQRLRQQAEQATAGPLPAASLLRGWADSWTENVGSFSREFWRELGRDHPESHALLRVAVRDGRQRARTQLAHTLRRGVDPNVADELLRLAVQHFTDSGVCERLGLSRRDAIAAVVEIWTLGALREGERSSK